MPFDEANSLRETANRLSVGLAARLDEFVNDFPAGAPSQLIQITKRFLDGINVEIEKTNDLQLLRQYCWLVNELASLLEILDNAHTAQTPRGLVQILEQTASALFSKSVLLVSPSFRYNYSISDIVPDLKRLATSCLSLSSRTALEASLPGSFYVVRFPRVERENILIHAIFGHEFGHPVASDFLTIHEQEKAYLDRLTDAQDKLQLDPDVASRLSATTDPLVRSQMLSKLVDSTTKLHRRGMEELISDAVGVYLLGPSALFAGFDVLNQSILDKPPSLDEGYPPSRYRIRLMYDLLEKSKDIDRLRDLKLTDEQTYVTDAVVAALDFIKSVVDDQADRAAIKFHAIARIAYEWIEQTLPDALSYCAKRIGRAAFPSVECSAQLPELLARLEIQVPPNEVGSWPVVQSVDWRSGVLAAWLLHLGHISDTSTPIKDRRQKLAAAQKLAAKGVEYAILRKQYEGFLAKGDPP